MQAGGRGSPVYWSERATADELRAASTVLLRQELARLHAAVRQVDEQTADPARADRFPSRAEYEAWKGRATQARVHKATAISRVEAVLDARGEPAEPPAVAAGRSLAHAALALAGLLGAVQWELPEDADIVEAIDRVRALAGDLLHS